MTIIRRETAILAISGCGAAWLARLLGVQEVPGSNPGSPTNYPLQNQYVVSLRGPDTRPIVPENVHEIT